MHVASIRSRSARPNTRTATGSGAKSTRCSRRGRSDAVIRAVLFDLDGVLADTERLQWAAYRRILAAFGVEVGLEEYRRHW
ncbi:MAG: HAD family phosphatase, partial [Deltaproteobacteria bacterium]